MKIEFEATFLGQDIDAFRDRLKKQAVLLKPETLMKRVVFSAPESVPGGWMRVRDESDKITMSLKQVTGSKVDDQKEVELIIDDFDAGVDFMKSIGATQKAYQETKRESWQCGDVRVEIDTWPGLQPFIEIEGKSESAIRVCAKQLGLDYSQAIFGGVDVVYEKELGIPKDVINNQTSEITFENPPQRYT
ncbi:class IV adenylate cyclase [Candidatus Nomurabacteria bacterium]|nr:class IV adenylate cyclase [Candidatus Nomurabacteria bacterium]